jgi:hypothetical protein
MNNYIVTYKSDDSLFSDYITIQGKNPVEAIKKAFNLNCRYVTGDEDRYSDIILVKGNIETSEYGRQTLRYEGRYRRLCYRINN